MKLNMGTVDRILRILLALVVFVLYYTHRISGTLALILGIFAVIFVITGLVGFCPLYTLFKFSTKKKKS